jgi:Uma2 family endonuclease
MGYHAILEDPGERLLTLAEWARLPEDDLGELVDGRLVEEEVPDAAHEVIVVFLVRMLAGWIIPRGGLVLGSDAKFAVKPTRGRKPDASVFFPGTRLPPRSGVIRTPPDVMIEVVSPTLRDGRRDRVEKLREYAAFGVRWYWIVDPQLRIIEIFELGADGRYTYALGATEGVASEIPGCDGLSLDMDALWSEVDRLGPAEAEDPLP